MNTLKSTHYLKGVAMGIVFFLSFPTLCLSSTAGAGTQLSATRMPEVAMIQEPIDLIEDRPSMVVRIWDAANTTLSWVWDTVYDYGLDWLTPPSPTSVTKSVNKKDAMQLFKLLSDAGYKLKEIDSQVGLIPTIAFKFGQVRELSEADFDYLEATVEEWYQHNPGVYSSLQRTIVDTVIAVNLSSEYHVSDLKVQLLPLPKVAFSVTPKVTALGEDSSALMTAIQRVDRNIQKLNRAQK